MREEKLFTKSTLLLTLAGLGFNVVMVQLLRLINSDSVIIPLFLDSIGTIAVAALGGTIPGVLVGFLSNCLNAFSDPITLYYGLLSIGIAVVASVLSKTGLFKKWWGYLVGWLIFSVIGGMIGSTLTWLLYGYEIGSGISAPLAIIFYNKGAGLSEFASQFIADTVIDLADKLITMGVLFLILRYLPRKLKDRLPLGYIYTPAMRFADCISEYKASWRLSSLRASLRTKIIYLVVATSVVLGILTLGIGTVLYRNASREMYLSVSTGASQMAATVVDGDKVGDYIAGTDPEGYQRTEAELQKIKDSFENLKYLYIYKITDECCVVVFDLDTEDLEGGEPGDEVPFDEGFTDQLSLLENGEKIEPVIAKGQYGYLMTAYSRITDSSGKTVAYAGADIDVEKLSIDTMKYFIRLFSLLFGATMCIVLFALWYGERNIANPLRWLVSQSRAFNYKKKENLLGENSVVERKVIKTGDEIEELYTTICESEDDISKYIVEVTKKNETMKNETITKLQQNTIYSFAKMVESRDKNTGDHIFRTSQYVRILTEELQRNSAYSDAISDEFLENVTLSAPLHDIGKISISDVILNKPGKLTDEEFNIMKSHVTAGRRFLKDTLSGIEDGGYLAVAMDMTTYHHEKWDGSGYMEGLKGEEIPLSARIMAVADVLDALVSKRSYKEPFSFDKAAEIIIEGSAKHFDPEIIKAFESVKDALRAVKPPLPDKSQA